MDHVFYIIDGHARAAAALRAGTQFVSAVLAASNDEPYVHGSSARQYVADAVIIRLSRIGRRRSAFAIQKRYGRGAPGRTGRQNHCCLGKPLVKGQQWRRPAAESLRARSRRLAWRLVLAARLGPAGSEGHKVFTPSLTGLGDRSHLMSKDVVLDTHIADIVNLFKWEDLKDVCLVAHSYGGWPRPARSSRLATAWRRSSGSTRSSRRTARRAPTSPPSSAARPWRRPWPRARPAAGPAAVGVRRQREGPAWVESEADAQPNGVATQPIKLTGAREKIAKKTYIRAPAYPQPAFDTYYAAKKPTRNGAPLRSTAATT